MYELRDYLIKTPANCSIYQCDCSQPEQILSVVGWSTTLCDWTDVSMNTLAQAIVDTGLLPDIYVTGANYTFDDATNIFNLIFSDNDPATPDFNVNFNFCAIAVDCIDEALAAGTLPAFCPAVALCLTTNGLPNGIDLFTFNGIQFESGGTYTTGLGANQVPIISGDTGNLLMYGADGLVYMSCEIIQDCIGSAIMLGAGLEYNDLLDAISVTVNAATACSMLNAITAPVTDPSGYRIPVMDGSSCGYIPYSLLISDTVIREVPGNTCYLELRDNANSVALGEKIGKTNAVLGTASVTGNDTGEFTDIQLRGENDTGALDTATNNITQKVFRDVEINGCEATDTVIVENYHNETLFVDEKFGDDATGIRERRDRPYQTITAAIFDSEPNDQIYIIKGDHTFTGGNVVIPHTLHFYAEEGVLLNMISRIEANGTNEMYWGGGADVFTNVYSAFRYSENAKGGVKIRNAYINTDTADYNDTGFLFQNWVEHSTPIYLEFENLYGGSSRTSAVFTRGDNFTPNSNPVTHIKYKTAENLWAGATNINWLGGSVFGNLNGGVNVIEGHEATATSNAAIHSDVGGGSGSTGTAVRVIDGIYRTLQTATMFSNGGTPGFLVGGIHIDGQYSGEISKGYLHSGVVSASAINGGVSGYNPATSLVYAYSTIMAEGGMTGPGGISVVTGTYDNTFIE